MAVVDVKNLEGKTVGQVELADAVWAVKVKPHLLHEAARWYLAGQRAGTHKTKVRSEVAGSGKKLWKQKGTGRARQGSIRATQWKGGGKPFGPTPRSYRRDLPRQMRRGALRAAVAARLADGALKVIESVGVSDGKTKSLVARLGALGLAAAPTLLVVGTLGEPLARAARNVRWLTVETPGRVSTYQILRAQQAVFERGALLALEEALGQ